MTRLRNEVKFVYNGDLHILDLVSSLISLSIGLNLIFRPQYHAYQGAITAVPAIYWGYYCIALFLVYLYGFRSSSRNILMTFNLLSLFLYATFAVLVFKITGFTTAITTYGFLGIGQAFSYLRRFVGRVF